SELRSMARCMTASSQARRRLRVREWRRTRHRARGGAGVLPETEHWVHDFLTAAQEPGDALVEDIADASASSDGQTIACTLTVRAGSNEDAERRIALVDVTSGRHQVVDLG